MRKLAIFAAGYSAAVFTAVSVLPEGALLPLGGFCVILACALAFLRHVLPDPVRRRALLCAAGMAVGMVWTWGYSTAVLGPARALDDRTVMLTGTVNDWPEETDFGARVTVRVRIPGGSDVTALLYIDRTYLDLRPGDRIEAVTHCSLATHSARGEEITYYTAKGIFLTGKTYGQLEVVQPGRLPLSAYPAFFSRALMDSIGRIFPQDAQGLVQALVTGDKAGLDDSFQTALQRTGLSHVVVVSGMHLAYIAELISFLLGRGRKRTALVTIPLVLLVAAMAGFTPSVVRASVMLILLRLAPLLGREGDSATSLSLALMLLLIQNPYCAASVSLLLSFGAVAGILLFATPINRYLAGRLCFTEPDRMWKRVSNRAVRAVTAVVGTSLGAMVFTIPVVVVCFGKISLIAPLSNLLCLWAVSLAYVGGAIAAGVGVVWSAGGVLAGAVVAPVVRYLNETIVALSRITLAAVPISGLFLLVWILFLYGAAVLGLACSGKKHWSVAAGAGVLLLAVAVLFNGVRFRSGDLTIQVLDVGQGQSVLLHSRGMYALVDCGGSGSVNAGDVAADSLEAMGENGLELLIVSHFHDDHANGVPQLLERVRVDRICIPDVPDETGLRQRIEAMAQAKQIELIYARRELLLPFGDRGTLRILPPVGKDSANERCLAVLCSVDDYDIVMTGDMDSGMEEQLLKDADLPDAELVVAGHHGSKYSGSERFLAHLTPEIAVFSAGISNTYGHPAPEVLKRYDDLGAEIYRTDLMGTVTINVDVCRE